MRVLCVCVCFVCIYKKSVKEDTLKLSSIVAAVCSSSIVVAVVVVFFFLFFVCLL